VNRAQRRQLLSDRVAELGEIGFAQAAQLYGVSEMTIRRDVEALEEQGLVRRVPGGVISTGESEPAIASRVLSQAREKEGIAQAVADLLVPGECILLDSGSTALAVAKAIRGRELGLTVVTPNLLAALELVGEPGTAVILPGGELRPGEMSLVGLETVQAYGTYNIDTYLMGVGGVDAERGISDYNRSEAAKKRAGVSASRRVIVCVDASKLDRFYLSSVAAIEDVDVLVTDGAPDNETIKAAQRAGVQVVLVDSAAYGVRRSVSAKV
jgi:DeoR/GlpR family transcriptional regulator of sugar metabolism